jgi:hypothetical protein
MIQVVIVDNFEIVVLKYQKTTIARIGRDDLILTSRYHRSLIILKKHTQNIKTRNENTSAGERSGSVVPQRPKRPLEAGRPALVDGDGNHSPWDRLCFLDWMKGLWV